MRAAPDFEFDFGQILNAIAHYEPFEIVRQAARGNPSAGMDAAHDKAEVVREQLRL